MSHLLLVGEGKVEVLVAVGVVSRVEEDVRTSSCGLSARRATTESMSPLSFFDAGPVLVGVGAGASVVLMPAVVLSETVIESNSRGSIGVAVGVLVGVAEGVSELVDPDAPAGMLEDASTLSPWTKPSRESNWRAARGSSAAKEGEGVGAVVGGSTATLVVDGELEKLAVEDEATTLLSESRRPIT